MNFKEKPVRRAIALPRSVYISICLLPVLSTILFYALRSYKITMDWISRRFSAPIRGALGLFSSIYPFSLMEVLCTLAGIWLIYYVIGTIIATARKREKLKILSKRLLTISVVVLYAWSAFCWLWNTSYHGQSFAERNGLSGGAVTPDDLAYVASIFLEKSNELAPLVERNPDGICIGDRQELLAVTSDLYKAVFIEYPDLETRLYSPKPMMYSWLMSRTGYTGVYFALTGESNINTRAPIFLLPATIAHELAHQCGVAGEDEASYLGILACVTSGDISYEYAGYLTGLIHLRNALFITDYDAWSEISLKMSEYVRRDLQINSDYWQLQKSVETGVVIIDNVLTKVNTVVSDTVNTAYDGFLKSQDQPLGLRSYDACVDLLVRYFTQ